MRETQLYARYNGHLYIAQKTGRCVLLSTVQKEKANGFKEKEVLVNKEGEEKMQWYEKSIVNPELLSKLFEVSFLVYRKERDGNFVLERVYPYEEEMELEDCTGFFEDVTTYIEDGVGLLPQKEERFLMNKQAFLEEVSMFNKWDI